MEAGDEQDLRELQAELLAAGESPWEPRCVGRAFGRAEGPFVLTMGAWIELDAARSPFLLLELPEAEGAVEAFEAAFRAFGHEGTTPWECDAEGLVLLGRKMIAAIREGFGMRLRLSPPEARRADAGADNGLGAWLPIYGCLVGQLGVPPGEAMRMPVGQAFALIAAHRCNQGWTVRGETYAGRDAAADEGGEGDGGDE